MFQKGKIARATPETRKKNKRFEKKKTPFFKANGKLQVRRPEVIIVVVLVAAAAAASAPPRRMVKE